MKKIILQAIELAMNIELEKLRGILTEPERVKIQTLLLDLVKARRSIELIDF